MGTLVERHTRLVLLLHLEDGRGADAVDAAMRQAIATLPAELARSITWDQGKEMANHAAFTIATGIPIYFCDPVRHEALLNHAVVKGHGRQFVAAS